MKTEIHIIAEAILANTQVLKMLVEKLPAATQAAVAEVVQAAAPAPVAPPPAPTPVQAPIVAPAPAPAPAPVEAPAPAPVQSSPTKPVPFTTQKELIAYMMDSYKQMGHQKGMGIQDVLTKIGIKNINEVDPSMYATLYNAVEAMK